MSDGDLADVRTLTLPALVINKGQRVDPLCGGGTLFVMLASLASEVRAIAVNSYLR